MIAENLNGFENLPQTLHSFDRKGIAVRGMFASSDGRVFLDTLVLNLRGAYLRDAVFSSEALLNLDLENPFFLGGLVDGAFNNFNFATAGSGSDLLPCDRNCAWVTGYGERVISEIPEPSAYLLFGFGLLIFGMSERMKCALNEGSRDP